MKIAILSMQRVDNMGSVLQAYALKRMLETRNNTVEFIDICSNDAEKSLLNNYVNDFSDEGEEVKTIGRLSRIDAYLLNRVINKYKMRMQHKLYEDFRASFLNIRKTSKEYQLCIIGSDEVFNCQENAKWGFVSQLFGNVFNSEKIITYAASCGATEYKNIPETVIKIIQKAFERISYFSVRDKNTLDFVKQIGVNKEVKMHFDPAFLYDFKDEIREYGYSHKDKRICVVYSYYNRINDKREIDMIKSFCKEKKMSIIALGAPQFWIRRYIPCSPFQCLHIFSRAEFIITDTFHGTIFSSRYSSKYAIITRKSNKNKLSDLISKLKINDHVVSNENTLRKIYNLEDKKDEIAQLRDIELGKMQEYFDESIGI